MELDLLVWAEKEYASDFAKFLKRNYEQIGRYLRETAQTYVIEWKSRQAKTTLKR